MQTRSVIILLRDLFLTVIYCTHCMVTRDFYRKMAVLTTNFRLTLTSKTKNLCFCKRLVPCQ